MMARLEEHDLFEGNDSILQTESVMSFDNIDVYGWGFINSLLIHNVVQTISLAAKLLRASPSMPYVRQVHTATKIK